MQKVVPASDRPFCDVFDNELAQFVSPVPEPQVWAFDALSLP